MSIIFYVGRCTLIYRSRRVCNVECRVAESRADQAPADPHGLLPSPFLESGSRSRNDHKLLELSSDCQRNVLCQISDVNTEIGASQWGVETHDW